MPSQLIDADGLAMANSIENRTPYLNLKLLTETMKIKKDLFIKNGYGKFFIRKAFKKNIPKSILNDRNKVGFNCSVKDLFNFKDKKVKNHLFNSQIINKSLKIEKIRDLIDKKDLSNSESHFLFSLLSINAFIKSKCL